MPTIDFKPAIDFRPGVKKARLRIPFSPGGAGFGVPVTGAAGEPLIEGIPEIGKAIRELIAPTTPYTEKEAIQAYKEIPRTLENAGMRLLTVGGLAGPLMGLKPSELRAALDEDIRSSAGFGEALAPALGETSLLAFEWGYLYPKLFAAVGITGKTIQKIPQVAKGTKALKAIGGIKKFADKYPRVYVRGARSLKAFTKGATVGTIRALPEALGEELAPGEVLKHVSKSAAIMGGVATAFQVASDVDTARYVKQLRNALIKTSNQRFAGYLSEVDNMPVGATKSAAYKSLASLKRTELRSIDKVVSQAEAQLLGLKKGKLYQLGQEQVETPQKAAERLMKYGLEPGRQPLKGVEALEKGLGKTEPFIKMPMSRAAEIIETSKAAIKATKHPLRAVEQAVAGKVRPTLPKIPPRAFPPPVDFRPSEVKEEPIAVVEPEEPPPTVPQKRPRLAPGEITKPEAVEPPVVSEFKGEKGNATLFEPSKPPIEEKGRPIAAVKLDDGTIYYHTDATIHADLINNFGIPAHRVVDGGFIIEGKYIEAGADARRIGVRAAAQKRVEEKRTARIAAAEAKPPAIAEEKAVLEKAEAELREVESERETTGISKQRRGRLLRQAEKQIAGDEVYQVELEGVRAKGAEIGVGFYYVPPNLRAEVEDIIGKRKGFPTKLQRMFSFDKSETRTVDTPEGKAEIHPTEWTMVVQEALGRGREGIEETAGEMDISDFVQRVKEASEQKAKVLDSTALGRARISNNPYTQLLIQRRDMIDPDTDGATATEIDEMISAWAEHYGVEESAVENLFVGPEALKLKEIKELPEAEQDDAIDVLARENVLRKEREAAKEAVNEVLKANDIEVEVEEVAEIREEDLPFERRRGRPTGAAIMTPAGREIVQLAYGADSETGFHEAYHTLRRHLTNKDRAVLDRTFKGDEEAEAVAFAEFAKTGKVKVGYLRAIWRKLVEKLRKIKSALQGKGYRTAQDIFGEIQRGVVRKEGAAPGAVQFERGVFGQPIHEQQWLSFPERQAAIKRTAVEEKKRAKPEAVKPPVEVPTEKIRAAAYYNPNTGEISEGVTHAEAAVKMKEFYPTIKEGKPAPKGMVEGFVTESGKFVTNKEAELIAKKSGQIKKDYKLTEEERILGRPTAQKILAKPPAIAKPYEEWHPKGRVPIKSALVKAVDAEIARTMKPRSNAVKTTPEEITKKIAKLPGAAELFYEHTWDGALAEVTEAFAQLVKGGPLFDIRYETTGEKWRREAERKAQINAEKARLKAKITPKKKMPSLKRLKIKIDEKATPILSRELGREPGARKAPPPQKGKALSDVEATQFLRDDLATPIVKPAQPIEKRHPGVPTPKLTQQWFDQNVDDEKMRLMGRVSRETKEISDQMGRYLWSSSTELYNIHPELFRRTREYEARWMRRTADMLEAVNPFLKKLRKLRRTNFADWSQLDKALKNSQGWMVDKLVNKHNMTAEYQTARDVYDELYEGAKQVGMDMRYRGDYWHREIKNSKGFVDHFYQTEQWSAIDQALKTRAARSGREVGELTDEEKAQVINTLLRGYRTQAVMLATPGAAKARLVPEVDKAINQFYYDSGTALVRYIRQMNVAIAQREFFGRETRLIQKLRGQQSRRLSRLIKYRNQEGLKEGTTVEEYKAAAERMSEALEAGEGRLERLEARDLTETIGGYVGKLKDHGYLTPLQERRVQNIISGILQPKRMGRILGTARTLMYLDTLNSFFQALTQLDEFAYAFQISPKSAIPAGIKTILRKNPVTLRDIGVVAPGVEFQEPNLKRALGAMLQVTGFRAMDVFGKETLINTGLKKYQKEAQKKKLTPKFVKEMVRVFGPKQYQQVIEELKQPIERADDGALSDNIAFLLFNIAADRQPIAHTEMPEKYNTSGNGRIFYTLKTFYLKRLDFVRNQCFKDMKSIKTFHRGFGKLIWIASTFALMGAGVDGLKDFIKGKPIRFADYVWDHLLKFVFMSKYALYRTETEGVGRAALETLLPPTKVIDAATRDILNKARDKDRGFELWRSVPLGGEPYYWWLGEGRRKIEAKKDETGWPTE